MVERVKRVLIFNFNCKNFTMGLFLGIGFGFITNKMTIGVIAGIILGVLLSGNKSCYSDT